MRLFGRFVASRQYASTMQGNRGSSVYAKKAGSEVVKFGDNPKLGGLIYPLMQSIDEEYLKVDIQYGGVDQRKILMFARENLPKLGYKSRIEVMTPLIPGLTSKKMSASDSKSKIDLLDDPKTVQNKIKFPAGLAKNKVFPLRATI